MKKHKQILHNELRNEVKGRFELQMDKQDSVLDSLAKRDFIEVNAE